MVYRDDRGQPYLCSCREADEAAALLTEFRVNPATGLLETTQPVRKRLLAIAGHIGREGLYLDLPATAEQLEGALLEAQQLLKHGRGLFSPAAWCYRSAMPPAKPMGANPPPRSTKESAEMLDSSHDWSEAASELWVGLQWIGGVVAILVAIGALALWMLGRFAQ